MVFSYISNLASKLRERINMFLSPASTAAKIKDISVDNLKFIQAKLDSVFIVQDEQMKNSFDNTFELYDVRQFINYLLIDQYCQKNTEPPSTDASKFEKHCRNDIIHRLSKLWKLSTITGFNMFLICIYTSMWAFNNQQDGNVQITDEEHIAGLMSMLETSQTKLKKTRSNINIVQLGNNMFEIEDYGIEIQYTNEAMTFRTKPGFKSYLLPSMMNRLTRSTPQELIANTYQMLALLLPQTTFYSNALDFFISSYVRSRVSDQFFSLYNDWMLNEKRIPLRSLVCLQPEYMVVSLFHIYVIGDNKEQIIKAKIEETIKAYKRFAEENGNLSEAELQAKLQEFMKERS